MNSFNIDLDDGLAGTLLLRAAKQGVSLSKLVSQLLSQVVSAESESSPTPVVAPMTLQAALDYAVEKVRKLPARSTFMLEDLFNQTEWDRVPSHRAFGRLFKQRLDSTAPAVARFTSKNGANKAVYVRL